jgi:adenosine deaminase
MPHLQELVRLDHHIVICCDDTMLFSTNISTELFEFANAFQVTGKQLKAQLLRNVDAIFDDSLKPWLKEQIESYRV